MENRIHHLINVFETVSFRSILESHVVECSMESYIHVLWFDLKYFMSVLPISLGLILNGAQNYLNTLQMHTFCSMYHSQGAEQLFWDNNFQVANFMWNAHAMYFHPCYGHIGNMPYLGMRIKNKRKSWSYFLETKMPRQWIHNTALHPKIIRAFFFFFF